MDMRLRPQAGKGPLPRPTNKQAQQEGYERIFGKKEPWWVRRDREAKQINP